jgi:hypothetical protein
MTHPLISLCILEVARGLKATGGGRRTERKPNRDRGVPTSFYVKIQSNQFSALHYFSCEGTQVVLDSRLIAINHLLNSYMVLAHKREVVTLPYPHSPPEPQHISLQTLPWILVNGEVEFCLFPTLVLPNSPHRFLDILWASFPVLVFFKQSLPIVDM